MDKERMMTLPFIKQYQSVVLSILICSLFCGAMYMSNVVDRATGKRTVFGTGFVLSGGCQVSDVTAAAATAGRMRLQQADCLLDITIGAYLMSPRGWACATSDRTQPRITIEEVYSDTTHVRFHIPKGVQPDDDFSFYCAPN